MSRSHVNLPSLRTQPVDRAKRIAELVKQMRAHIGEGKPVNFSNPPHVEITEALHILVYQEPPEATLNVIYADGSRGRGIPVARLWKPDDGWDFHPRPRRHLQIGTLSLRHVDYDRHVDMYLLRDKETRHLNQGAVDNEAYEQMRMILDAPQLQEEFYISIFQAGLEPLAVGLYRAITEHLIYRNEHGLGPLRVRPIFRVDDKNQPVAGTIWGTGMVDHDNR